MHTLIHTNTGARACTHTHTHTHTERERERGRRKVTGHSTIPTVKCHMTGALFIYIRSCYITDLKFLTYFNVFVFSLTVLYSCGKNFRFQTTSAIQFYTVEPNVMWALSRELALRHPSGA